MLGPFDMEAVVPWCQVNAVDPHQAKEGQLSTEGHN